MLVFLARNWKYALLVANVLLFALIMSLGYSLSEARKGLSSAENLIKAKDDKIQEFNSNLGIAKSSLVEQKELIKKYKHDLDNLDKELKKTMKNYDLALSQRDKSISYWKNKARTGTQVVTVTIPEEDKPIVLETVCGDVTISYSWEDDKKRFHLKDPDISVSGDEDFEYKQFVSVKGLVFSDESGKLQIRRVEVQEVVPEKTSDGKTNYVPVSNQKVRLVDSNFEYTNKPLNPKRLTDIFGTRFFASFDTNLYPGVGVEVLNLGEIFDYANLGLYTKLGFDLTNNFSNINNSTAGVGVSYNFIPPLLDTNLAIGASINTPFNDFGRMNLSIDAIFYLTNR